MKILISLSRRVATKNILYHGTSTLFLKSILSEGLLANPAKRVWKNDPNAGSLFTSRQSLFGVYATSNIMTACSSATNAVQQFGGQQMIVIIKGQIRSGFHDEDTIRFAIEGAFSGLIRDNHSLLGTYYAMYLADKYKIDYDTSHLKEALKTYVDTVSSRLEKDIPQIKEKLQEIFIILLRRMMFYAQAETKGSWSTPVGYMTDQFYRKGVKYEGINRYGSEDPEGYNPYTKHNDNDIPEKDAITLRKSEIVGDRQKEEQVYLAALEKLTRSFRSTLPKNAQEAYRFTVRFPEDVKFSGANKIVAIVQDMLYGKDKPDATVPLKVHYGVVPDEFEIDYKERVIGRNAKFVLV